ncbi:MAG: NUDIX domain-containing protein [Bacteriovoracaceae bacterium]
MKITPVAIVMPVKLSKNRLHVWLQERESSDELNGLLEFPGGKIESNETPVLAAVRETLEETGIDISPADLALFKIYTHIYSNKNINLYAYLLTNEKARGLPEAGWQELDRNWEESYVERIPAANREIFKDLVDNFLSKNSALP